MPTPACIGSQGVLSRKTPSSALSPTSFPSLCSRTCPTTVLILIITVLILAFLQLLPLLLQPLLSITTTPESADSSQPWCPLEYMNPLNMAQVKLDNYQNYERSYQTRILMTSPYLS